MAEMSTFARTIMEHTYAHETSEGLESWEQIAYRVTKNVMRSVGVDMRQQLAKEICRLIEERKFIPGGRYLYSAGREYHQVCNCLLLGVHDSREGWAELLSKASMALMSGAGIGVNYSNIRHEGTRIRRTGGVATGPIALMQMLNECGRGIIQGGCRRSAIWAGLRWSHPDIHKFLRIKNWPPEIHALKAKDSSFPATLDCTNISVQLDDLFFEAYHDDEHELYAMAHSVYWAAVEQMLKTGEPGFTVDTGKNAGESLRNAPLGGGVSVLTNTGYSKIKDIVGQPVTLWTGKQWASNCIFSCTGKNKSVLKIELSGRRSIVAEPLHEFFVERWEGKGKKRRFIELVKIPAKNLQIGDVLHTPLPAPEPLEFSLEDYIAGFIYGDGSIGTGGQADISFCTLEKKKLLPYFLNSSNFSSLTKGDSRGYSRVYFKAKSYEPEYKQKFPILNLQQVASWLAGYFDADGSYNKNLQTVRLSAPLKTLIFVRESLERFGIGSTLSRAGKSGYTGKQCYLLTILQSSILKFSRFIPTKRLQVEAENYTPYRKSTVKVQNISHEKPQDVFCCDVKVPEHAFIAEGVLVSNCCEVSSRDSDETCNLGSINLSRVETLEEFKHIIDVATAFLLAGSVYSDVPYSDVDRVREKNRRLGLGLMGVHEWLLKRGKPYAPDEELGRWLVAYSKSGRYANKWADEWGLSRPKKTRAIAPNGTTGIVAETTGGIEPIFCVAYKRRYEKGQQHCYQYVIDPTAKRIIESGVNPDSIEDAYTLAQDIERRVAFQAWVQGYVDHCISSTINLPAHGSELNNANTVRPFGSMLIRYLPNLRGITCYPDGGRSGQPLTPVSYTEAVKQEGAELVEEAMDVCNLKTGSCGD